MNILPTDYLLSEIRNDRLFWKWPKIGGHVVYNVVVLAILYFMKLSHLPVVFTLVTIVIHLAYKKDCSLPGVCFSAACLCLNRKLVKLEWQNINIWLPGP